MNEETIKKIDKLISHFGSVEKYQAGIFDYDRNSMFKYLKREMEEHSLTIDELIERDKKNLVK